LRSPTLLHKLGGARADWRFFIFADGGWLRVIDPLPGQKNNFDFLSYGAGSRWQLSDHFSGSVVGSVPKLKEGDTAPDKVRVTFQGALTY
jgi:hemolysin activation/secretion protein